MKDKVNRDQTAMKCLTCLSGLAALALLATLMLSSAWADDPKARQIMEKVDARDDGDNMTSDMQMVLIDKNENERIRLLRTFIKDKGQDQWKLMFFLEPADVEDTAFLSYDYYDADKDDDQWLYLPALRKTKRIASSDKSSAFMGSDFFYADMTREALDNYDYELLKEMDVEGHKVWLIERVPRSERVIDQYGYTKSVLFVRQDNFVVVRAVHWVKEGGRLKYMDVKKLELIDGIWQPIEKHMTTKKANQTLHKTILMFQNVKFNQDLEESFFSVRQMEKGL
jgi:outer membrane lipoprotein-sorting protein